MPNKIIRNVEREDAKAICEIYNHYVENTNISFEEHPVTTDEMEKRIVEKIRSYPWLVYEEDGNVLGYAYVGKWRDRSAYRYTVEDTIYVKNGESGKGIGSNLFEALIGKIRESNKIHTILGVIALPNNTSIRLHEKYGFKKVAYFKEVGYKAEKWIDIGTWELLLTERGKE